MLLSPKAKVLFKCWQLTRNNFTCAVQFKFLFDGVAAGILKAIEKVTSIWYSLPAFFEHRPRDFRRLSNWEWIPYSSLRRHKTISTEVPLFRILSYDLYYFWAYTKEWYPAIIYQCTSGLRSYISITSECLRTIENNLNYVDLWMALWMGLPNCRHTPSAPK